MVGNFEVVVVRDPDAGTEVLVFVDGRQVAGERVSVTTVDPGAGFELHEWRAAGESMASVASSAAGSAISAAFARFDDSSFITTDDSCTHVDPESGELCGASLEDGEGYDGECGPHADASARLG